MNATSTARIVTPAIAPDAIAALRAAAGRASALLKTMANEDRLLLLCHLALGEQNVGELEAQCGIRQPTLSQQLAVLRAEGLIQPRRQGKYIYYRVVGLEVLQVLQTLHAVYCPPPAHHGET